MKTNNKKFYRIVLSFRFHVFIPLLFAGMATVQGQTGFLHTEGQNIVSGNGEPVLLRGMGLGGWMLQEGYMLETSDFANPQHEIEAAIEAVAGPEGKAQFYEAWLENYCTKADIDSMAAWGFNSIRLPMHYKLFTLPIENEPVAGQDTWLAKGFEMIDALLEWCGDNEIYLILDLHSAPGGQGKDAAISDYDPTKPSLWESAENRRKTVALWQKLAERYAGEPWIGGYDLINEPNWDIDNAGNENGCSCNQNTALWNLYKEIIAAIRTVDPDHMVIIEGNCWGNRYNGMPAARSFDSNLVLSFHKYATYNDEGSIEWMLNLRNTHNVPVWLGEAGENANSWFANAINLVESNNIGWAWWPYKKIGSVTCPVTIPKTEGYQRLLNYWNNSGSKPSEENARAWLLEQADRMRLENCTIHYDVLDALFRQAQGDKSPRPYKKNRLPGIVFAADYDLGGNGYAYFDQDSADYRFSTDVYTAWNTGWAYRNDGVDLEACTDAVSNGNSVGWTNAGEWLLYTVDVDSSAGYTCSIRYAANSASGKYHLEIDGNAITQVQNLPATGGWYNWATHSVDGVILEKGTHQLKLCIDAAGFNINFIECSNPVALSEIPPQIFELKTDETGQQIYVVTNLGLGALTQPRTDEFELTVNGQAYTISDIGFVEGKEELLILRFNRELIRSDRVYLSYSGISLISPNNEPYPNFSMKPVENLAPDYVVLPARIEAEDFAFNSGFQTETCTDTGGGENLGYADAGDYADYLLYSETEADYMLEYRMASQVNGRIKALLYRDDTELTLHAFTLGATGGWQNWKTLSENIHLPAGKSVLRLQVVSGQFNLNWIRFSKRTEANLMNSYSNGWKALRDPSGIGLLLQNKQALSGEGQLYLFDRSGKRHVRTSFQLDGQKEIRFPHLVLPRGLCLVVVDWGQQRCCLKVR